MANETYIARLGFKKILKISFGLATALFLLWLIFNSFAYVPEGKEDVWQITFIAYGVLGSYVFGSSDIRSKLYSISFFKSLPRLFLYIFGSLVFFYFLLNLVDPFPSVVSSILENAPWWLLIVHAFVFATIESSFWQGYLDERIGIVWSAFSAGLFHMFIWFGLILMNFIGASILFFMFSGFHYYFSVRRGKKNDLIPVIGFHTAFNFVKLGIILSIIG